MLVARRSATTVGVGLLAFLIIALPLARGGVDWPVRLAAALLSPLALVLIVRSEERAPRAGLALATVLAVMVLQVLPLPPLLHGISPGVCRVFGFTLAPIGLYPSLRPLSLDVPSSARELGLAVASLSAFWAAWSIGAGRQRRSILVWALAASGVAVTLVVLVGSLTGIVALLAPRAPFINPNHLAGFALLTAFPILGLALRSRGMVRLLLALCFVSTSLVAFLSLSRAGVGAYFGGAALFGVLAQRRPARESGVPSRSRLAIAGVVATALAIAASVTAQPVMDRFSALGVDDSPLKTHLWAPALTIAWEHPLFGIGRGAFGSTFPAYKVDSERVTYTHLENEWLQPIVELGFPAGLLLVGTIGLTWAQAARRRDLAWTDVGLLSGTAALAAQNLFDFSLELPGVAVPFMVGLGLATRGAGCARIPRWVLVALAPIITLIGAAGVLVDRAHPSEAVSREVARAADADAAVSRARAAAWWRPVDYIPHAAAGIRLVDDGRCAEALPWLTRAMLLNPSAAEPHLSAAICLAAAGQRGLALREFRLAWTYGEDAAFAEAATWYPEIEALLLVAPDTPNGLARLGWALLSSRPADAAIAFRRALDEFGEESVVVPLARASLAAGDAEGALDLALRRVAKEPSDAEAWRIVADFRLGAGDEPGAVESARLGLSHAPGARPLQGFLYERAMAARRFSEARRLASEIAAHSPEEVAGKLLLEARALAAQGRLGEAIEVARSASGADPGASGPLLVVATYCEQAGNFDGAIAAIERAAALPGQSPAAYDERLRSLAEARAAQLTRRRLQGLDR